MNVANAPASVKSCIHRPAAFANNIPPTVFSQDGSRHRNDEHQHLSPSHRMLATSMGGRSEGKLGPRRSSVGWTLSRALGGLRNHFDVCTVGRQDIAFRLASCQHRV